MIISLVLLFISIFIGYFLAKFALTPFIERNRFLDRLLKDTLHELNIPIATINANINMLKRKERDEKKLKRLSRVELASKKLLKLYNELDYFIKKEINSIDSEEFNLKELIEEELKSFEEIRGDIEIEKNLEDISIVSNRSGFIKVVDNLISNAIKYNKPNRKIIITLTSSKLVIEDSGVGMSEDEVLKIFDRYYQSSGSNSGYGIGLNIVKSFCDEYKIHIKIESEKDIGSRFILDLKNIILRD